MCVCVFGHRLSVCSHGLSVCSHGLSVCSHSVSVCSPGSSVSSHGLSVRSHDLSVCVRARLFVCLFASVFVYDCLRAVRVKNLDPTCLVHDSFSWPCHFERCEVSP